MKDEGLISIVIPTYNRRQTIRRAIESVLKQTYKNIEVIVVDDCSEDETVEELSSIHDTRIRYYRLEKNSGACAARNKGIELAKGSYIAFQDSDDTWQPQKLEKQIQKLLLFNADIIFCKARRHEYNSEADLYFPNLSEGFVDKTVFKSNFIVSTQLILGKAECLKSEQFDVEMPRFQDFDLMFRISEKYSVYFLDDVLVDIYLQNDSITNDRKKSILALERLLKKYKDIFEEYPEAEITLTEQLARTKSKSKINDISLYERLYELQKKPKNFLKLILAKTRLLQVFYYVKCK